MNEAEDLTIRIPAAIRGLPGLTLAERTALARLDKWPGSSNSALAKLLGISKRGAENLLRRLRRQGLIHQIGKGRARRHKLTFHVEQHTLCGKSEQQEAHTECVVGSSSLALVQPEQIHDFIAKRLAFYESCFHAGNYDAARHHLTSIRKRLESDTAVGGAMANWLLALKAMENRCFGFHVGNEMARELPPGKQEVLALALCRAKPDQLERFRQRVESGACLKDGEGVIRLLAD